MLYIVQGVKAVAGSVEIGQNGTIHLGQPCLAANLSGGDQFQGLLSLLAVLRYAGNRRIKYPATRPLQLQQRGLG